MNMLSRFAAIPVMLAVSAVPGLASEFSFTGNFFQDNDVVLFSFHLNDPGTVTLQTWSYGGGFNQRGDLIDSGGFEPVLQVYEAFTGAASSGLLIPGTYSSCGPNNPDGSRLGACFDIYAQIVLPGGYYYLALAQNPNTPLGSNNLSDGWQYDADPNFNNGFVGSFGFQGRTDWAVDILSVDDAALTPEPSSGALLGAAFLAALAAGRMRRRKESKSRQAL
jgi:hypothetical protein